uniref:Putative LOC100904750 [Metaseiulus occidentalis] n=1 Tax=Lepeophtheirus salmonis TaxID=72036 RepID=A0A0K2T0V7_LEPSM
MGAPVTRASLIKYRIKPTKELKLSFALAESALAYATLLVHTIPDTP